MINDPNCVPRGRRLISVSSNRKRKGHRTCFEGVLCLLEREGGMQKKKGQLLCASAHPEVGVNWTVNGHR